MNIGPVLFAQKVWLWGCLAIPVFYFISRWFLIQKKREFERFAATPVWGKIAPELDWSLPQKKFNIWLLSLFFMFLALARPQWGVFEETVRTTGLDIMLVLDVSRSMEVEDITPNRLKKVKHFIRTFAERVPGDRLGVVAFAGSAQLSCPLTTDHDYLLDVIEGLGPDSIAAQGTDLGGALEMAVRALDRGAEQLADPGHLNASSRVVVLISDGEDNEKQIEAGAKKIKAADTTLYVLGIGTEKGGPIPIRDALGQTIGFKRDQAGKTVLSQFNSEALKNLASQAGGKYWQISLMEAEVDQIVTELGALARGEMAERKVAVKKERFQIPLLIAVVLLLMELSMRVRKSIVTIMLVSLFFGATSARADDHTLTLKAYRENKKGVEALSNEKIQDARKHFSNAQVESPLVSELQFNQGVLQLKEENLAGAQASFQASAETASEQGQFDVAARAYFNQGVIKTQQKDWSGALDAYVSALRENQKAPNPQFESDVRKNIELLTQSQQENQQNSEDQKKDDQKDQSDQKDKSQSDSKSGKNSNSGQSQDKNQEKNDQQKDPEEKDSEKEKKENKNYQSNGKREFKSEKLSPEAAKRVMSELSQREKELQKKLERMKGRPQGLEKDW